MCVEWQTVLCSWESMAGLGWGLLGLSLRKCAEIVVFSLWDQARSRAGQGCSQPRSGIESSEPIAQGGEGLGAAASSSFSSD